MHRTLLLIILFYTIFTQPSSPKFRKYCISNTQCDPRERCIPDISGLLLCQQVLEQIPITDLQPKQITCQNDAQCHEFGKCMRLGWHGSCQYESLVSKNSGVVNDRCYSDADCAQYLHCVNRNGMMTCQVIAGMPSYKICQSNADCDMLQMCSFNKQYNTNLCVTSPEYQRAGMNPSWNNIGSGVIPSDLIGNGAIPMKLEKQCTADYQCSVFEICAEGNIQGNRICMYNPTSSNRQCRFNADCQAGQRCEQVLENLYLCRAAKQTTFMQPCNYDYECSDGQRCININNNNFFQQNLRYCLFDEGPGCEDDTDCTDGKVCRISGKFKQCVPIILNSHLTP